MLHHVSIFLYFLLIPLGAFVRQTAEIPTDSPVSEEGMRIIGFYTMIGGFFLTLTYIIGTIKYKRFNVQREDFNLILVNVFLAVCSTLLFGFNFSMLFIFTGTTTIWLFITCMVLSIVWFVTSISMLSRSIKTYFTNLKYKNDEED